MNIRPSSFVRLLAMAALILLTACGGGGSGGFFFPGVIPPPPGPGNSYLLGGRLLGLAGGRSVAIERTDAQGAVVEQLVLTADGEFQFAQRASGEYRVRIATQPVGQSCSVGNGAGVPTTDVTDILISCDSASYVIGGTLKGLVGGTVVLRNNGADDLALAVDGPFAFATPLAHGASYQVTVQSQPAGQLCAVADDQGIADAGLKPVQVSCQANSVSAPANPPANLRVSYGPKRYEFAWDPVDGASYYQLMEDPDGAGPQSAAPIGGHVGSAGYAHTIALHERVNATYTVQACNAAGCSAASAPLTPDPSRGIGYFKASNTDSGDEFGFGVALSGDGRTLAVGAPGEGSGATGVDGDQADNTKGKSGAVYLFVRVDGVWVQQSYLKASNSGAGDKFGSVVALSNDGSTLAVSAVDEASSATGIDGNQSDDSAFGAGAVYVFTRNGAAVWSQQAYIKASNAEADDQFGNALSLSADGNMLAVGAFGEGSAATGVNGNSMDNSAPRAGAAYVFARSGTAWAQQAYIKASNAQSPDWFGSSVALSGDGSTLVVGAYVEASNAVGVDGDQTNNAAAASGAAYVFVRSGVDWTQQAYLKPSNTKDGARFGQSMALSADGNTLAVGAFAEASSATGIDGDQASTAADTSGAVYVFVRSGATWGQQAYVKASNTGAGDSFSYRALALSADGNTMAIGASSEDSAAAGINGDQASNGAVDSGAVYVFTRAGTAWAQTTYAKAPNASAGDQFGFSLALSGDGKTLAAGAPFERSKATGIGGDQSDRSARLAGAVYLF